MREAYILVIGGYILVREAKKLVCETIKHRLYVYKHRAEAIKHRLDVYKHSNEAIKHRAEACTLRFYGNKYVTTGQM